MKARRLLLAGTGVVVLLLGFLGGDFLPTEGLVDLLGNDYLLMALFAGVGLLVAFSVLASGRSARLEQAEMPDAERPVSAPSPGEGFDEALSDWRLSIPILGRRRRASLRNRLRRAAIETLRTAEGYDRAEAERRVDEGTWTDDETAAAFLRTESSLRADGGEPSGPRRASSQAERSDGGTPAKSSPGARGTRDAARQTAEEIARLASEVRR
ncbi:hypothetical protein AUR64_16975 [Haloprofundus marisrubri]|uniref:Uncharacterized protein n=1 Tax=Haloprofundus marisrubri TaxID=1514971 RepID=A0A0W1R8A3_9EURY|nr:hypothetical protein [Haloprofundus marisrubri]KTG09468.1 hypothetical protein AUR64_16975 [Haloprofundus marisrubri]